jgi:aminomethyltransferase
LFNFKEIVMLKQTPLFEQHQSCKARIVDFHGWMLPLHYGSYIDEYYAVRQDAAIFDISHMTMVDIHGQNTWDFLRYLLANDIVKLNKPGKALYTAMLNTFGGVIDDLIVYFIKDNSFRVVANAATKDKDLYWIRKHASFFGSLVSDRDDLAFIALQGPKAKEKLTRLFRKEQYSMIQLMEPFSCMYIQELLVATTGYTGELGYEIALPKKKAVSFWNASLSSGFKPAGLGARDILRLEAGLNLYGNEINEGISPIAANMERTISLDSLGRNFIGRIPVEQYIAKRSEKLVGLLPMEKGMLRKGFTVYNTDDNQLRQGIITSGSFSPILGCSIALARVSTKISSDATVQIRDKKILVKVTQPCFVQSGKPVTQ